ncbi:MAG: DUF1028 domain-containing protein [Planctomycetota bacterium]
MHTALARRVGALLTWLLALAIPASATYSIVVINHRTGEVGVAVATCIPGYTLKNGVPVIRVGVGAAACQSFLDLDGDNRELINDSFIQGLTPDEILALLAASDSRHETRQYGIVSFDGPPVTFTGVDAGAAVNQITGVLDGEIPGEWEYAIQGNVLTGAIVVTEGERAFRATQGDTAMKMLAAMDSMRAMGGDGRCSCTQGNPTGCGAPPASFTFSAYTAWIAIARPGDSDGATCNGGGCATGDYYMERFFRNGQQTGEDATTVLIRRSRRWRENLLGLPDHVHTEVELDRPRLIVGDPLSGTVTVRLRDIANEAVAAGGQTLTATSANQRVAISGLTDNGDGTHTFTIAPEAGATEGVDEITLTVETPGERPVQLHPPLAIELVDAGELHVAEASMNASAEETLDLVLRRSPADAGRPYRIYASLSGTSPATQTSCALVPLVSDRLFGYTSTATGGDPFIGSTGLLDSAGRAEATFRIRSTALIPFIGSELSFAAVVEDGAGSCSVTNVATTLIQ